jgi:hypothetical protein
MFHASPVGQRLRQSCGVRWKVHVLSPLDALNVMISATTRLPAQLSSQRYARALIHRVRAGKSMGQRRPRITWT